MKGVEISDAFNVCTYLTSKRNDTAYAMSTAENRENDQLTRLAVAEISDPEVLMVWIHERDQRRCSVHAQPSLPPVRAAPVLVVDDVPNLSVGIVVQPINRTSE